ncbi:MAG TPA: helix-turn-helix domain-containing protein [Burkholderiaceae bacterium]|nr:helix-turn-helix domain-containing protein [Burkholderiaceae bacterium]
MVGVASQSAGALQALPTDRVVLTFSADGDIALTGLRTARAPIPQRCSMPVGLAVLSPASALRVFRRSLAEIVDASVALGDLIGTQEAAALARLLQSSSQPDRTLKLLGDWLQLQQHRGGDVEAGARRVIAATRLALHPACRGDTVSLAQAVGVGERQLLRDFGSWLGVSPSEWLRLMRLQRSLASIAIGMPLAEVATLQHYADQSHMSRDIRRWTGRTPSELSAEMAHCERRQVVAAMGSRVMVSDSIGAA